MIKTTPQKRVNKLIKDLKNTPHQIGLVYLEELLVQAVKSDISKMFLTDGHMNSFIDRVNNHITNNRQ